MAYESTPKRLHLESYYAFAGVKDGKIRRPTLYLNFDAKSNKYKLFPKYALIHIDKREQPHRNINNVDWSLIAKLLLDEGYTVVQVGKNEHEEIKGAVQFNCSTQELLLMACAGADLFIGADSGISHVCVAFGVPSIIAFGSVNPEYIHPDLTNIYPIHMHENDGVCGRPFCWHESVTTTGQDCYIGKENPPCTQFSALPILETIVKIINLKKTH
jgi:ADP-heptose:LPS heptosyltransferase